MQAWRNFEERVRSIASLRFGSACVPEHLGGVDFDGVIRLAPDEIYVIEITTNVTLQKVRDDLAKIAPFRIASMANGVFCRGYIVLDENPTNSMREAGQAHSIKVCSLLEFEREFFDFDAYKTLRAAMPFGSAVDSRTGLNDERSFVPVDYVSQSGKKVSLEDLASRLIGGNRVILTGDYGTGKSRCVREVFTRIAERVTASGAYPLAINLRDHWSSSTALEVIAGHLGNVGLQSSVDNLIRLLNSGALVLLLDGFDEIGTQIHDSRVHDRKALRKHAVRGLRDLIARSRAGVMMTGRPHFFDSDKEMLEALGLSNASNVSIVGVPESFTVKEAESYLKELGVEADIPAWLPCKPLVFQLLAEIGQVEVRRLLSQEFGEYEFWAAFLQAVSVRESRGVGESISAETVREILLELSVRSRYSSAVLGRLSPSEIDEAYETVVSSNPDEAGRLLLSRLCTLGRIEPESPDRQFIDYDFVDVLRAEHLIADIAAMSDRCLQAKWKQGLKLVGIIYAANLVENFDLKNSCFSFLRKYGTSANTWLLGEVVSLLSIVGDGDVDYQSIHLVESYVPILNFHKKSLKNLKISKSEIMILDINSTTVSAAKGVAVDGCIVSKVFGISGIAGMPAWVSAADVIEFDAVGNSSSIKQSDIPGANKLLLSIVHKIFFQRGSGREEAALRKGGFGQEYSSKLVERILALLMREGVVKRIRGDEGWIYQPVRSETARMNSLRSELSLSKDPIWAAVSELRD